MLKKIFALLTSAAVMLSAMPLIHADNPIVQTSFTPDPAPMVYDGVMYLYVGEDSEEDNGFYNMIDWHVFSTTDMANWTDLGVVLSPEDFSWADPGSAWAAQCIERNGKFYLYVTLTNSGGRAIGVAVGDSPTGPFKDALGKPLCGPNWLYIDPTVMIDDDGQAYLYFGNPNAYYCKLNEDMISIDGEIMQQEMNRDTFGPKPSYESEAPSNYTEGPWIYKREGIYYLVFASHGVPEGIAYSTSDSPTGPWEYQGTIMEPGDSTTIHPGIIEYKGHDYFFYHGVLLPNGGWNKRSACVMEFDYKEDGSIPRIMHSDKGVDQLENFDPFRKVEAETMSFSSGLKSLTVDRKVYITDISDKDYIKLSGVDFKNGAKSFSASFAANGSGKVDIRLDSADGKKIGSLSFSGKSAEKFDSFSCNLSGNSGVHDLYFVFSASNGAEIRFDSWEFSKEKAADAQKSFSMPIVLAVVAVVIIISAAAVVLIKNKKK